LPSPSPLGLPSPATSTTTTSPTGSTTLTDYGAPPVLPFIPAPPDLTNWLPLINPYTWNPTGWLPTLPSPSCTYEIHTMIFNRHFDMAPCVPLQPLRTILNWVFSILTIWACFLIIFKSGSVTSGV
jgi:hypothetical protein